MLPQTERWFRDRTWQCPTWGVDELIRAKAGRTVSIVMPALNEEATVASVVRTVLPFTRAAPGCTQPLVDELVVVDSGSTDRTVAVAAEAGARVVRREDVLPGVDPVPGKGEVLWRSLSATQGDLIVFLDSDLIDPDPAFVPGLLGPLLLTSGVHLVKGFYRRPLRTDSTPTEAASGGGRVTELMARPLLAALRPELAGVVQPLGGEYAATRQFLESVPFAAGYGVEIGLLIDAHSRYGLCGLAQVNLGVREHRNQTLVRLGVMARQILGTALARCGVCEPATSTLFTQFVQVEGEWLPDASEVLLVDRPPMRDMVLRDVDIAPVS
jgi:glucosyl-3-phosphoglycerate synthase